MCRRHLNILISIAILVCIGSITHTVMTPGIVCPHCSRRAVAVSEVKCLSPCGTIWAISRVHRCLDCESDFVGAAKYVPVVETSE